MSDENNITGSVTPQLDSKDPPTVLESLEARVSALEEKVESRLSAVEKVLARLFHPSQW